MGIRSLESVRDPGRLPGWVYETLEKECERISRRRRRDEEGMPSTVLDRAPAAGGGSKDLPGAAGEAGDSAWADDLDAFVRREVESLPADLRVVVERGGMGGERLTHLARDLGVPRTALADRRHRAYEILRPRFGRRMGGRG